MKKKNIGKEILEGICYIASHLLLGFVGQLGALAAYDYYRTIKEEFEDKKPIGFRIDD